MYIEQYHLIKRNQPSLCQIWNDILAHIPNPPFTRRAVHYMWSVVEKTRWKRADDEFESARKLLKEGQTPGGLGNFVMDEIQLNVPHEMKAVAFAVPKMLEMWKSQIQEIAIDSACKWMGYMIMVNVLLGLPSLWQGV